MHKRFGWKALHACQIREELAVIITLIHEWRVIAKIVECRITLDLEINVLSKCQTKSVIDINQLAGTQKTA